jgi:disulfide bond formation protein DsbB
MRTNSQFAIALAVLLIALASVAGALIFEALGYAPCELCLKERIPYYVAIPIAGFAIFFAAQALRVHVHATLIALVLIFAVSAIFGAYHAGVEWGFWPGPQDCSGSLDHAATAEDFLAQLQSVRVTRCDVPALKFLGLSLAAWNMVISAGLAALAGVGLLQRRNQEGMTGLYVGRNKSKGKRGG